METFKGYIRRNGQVGIRNYVLIIPTVSCAVGVAQMIEKQVPGTVALIHGQGCAKVPERPMHIRTLENIGKNPNTYAALYIGLGCEGVKALSLIHI